MSNKKIQVVYDKQCPACSLYCELFQSSVGADDVELLDARACSELMEQITEQGLDIDEGMVVVLPSGSEEETKLHYGADAINVLGQQKAGTGWFAAINALLFRSRRVARFLYPMLRSVRNFLLRILGIRRINNLKISGREKF